MAPDQNGLGVASGDIQQKNKVVLLTLTKVGQETSVHLQLEWLLKHNSYSYLDCIAIATNLRLDHSTSAKEIPDIAIYTAIWHGR